MSGLKPYEEYRETEYDWLGSIPKHWEKLSIRSITELSSKRNGERTDLELLSVYREYGVIKKSSRDDNHNVESEDLSNYKYVGKGYLALNKMKMWQGSLGISKYEGIVSPAYIVCKLKNQLNSNYINYLLRADIFKTIYNRLSYGIRVGQWDMRYDDFKNIKLYIPPREEQDQIVKYLDSKLSKVNKFIKAKKKQIELLKEQKQAIINQAVTKGLDPNVKMKPSGIEWIGDIPDGWEVVQLRRVTKTIKTGGTPQGADDKYYADNGFNWFTPSDFNESLYLKDSSRQLSELGKQSINLFPANTIMMIGIGATMGKVSISEGVCSCNQQINAIVCNVLVDERYLTYYLRAKKQYILDTAKYTTLPILNQDETKKIPILKCNINEQLKIVTYTEAKVEVIDKAIDILKKEIDLITEYRISLISDVVTGKVDVRNIEIQDVDKETEEGFEDTDDEIIDEENGEIGEGV